MTEEQSIRNQQHCEAIRKKLLKRSCGDLAEFEAEALRFDALTDFERQVILKAAGASTIYSCLETMRRRTVTRFAQLATRDRLRVARVLPLIAQLGAKVAA